MDIESAKKVRSAINAAIFVVKESIKIAKNKDQLSLFIDAKNTLESALKTELTAVFKTLQKSEISRLKTRCTIRTEKGLELDADKFAVMIQHKLITKNKGIIRDS